MWFKVDDKLHDHAKTRKAGKSAMGVWVLAGSWSMDNETNGFVPKSVLNRWGTRADARKLVAVGLWETDTFQGEDGYRFHDWSHFQPSTAVMNAKRDSEREAGIRGNHKRWHVARKVSDPSCEYCYRVPDRVPDWIPDDDPIGYADSPPNRPEPEPIPKTRESADRNQTPTPAATRKRPATRLPDDWQPTTQHLEKRQEGIDVDREAKAFRLYAEANDRRYVNWNAAFSQWLLRARPINGTVRQIRKDTNGHPILPPLPPRNPWAQ